MKWVVFTFAVLALAITNATQLELKGGKVYYVYPTTPKQRLILAGMENNLEGVDFWQSAHVLGSEARILVAKNTLIPFEAILDVNNIKYEIIMEDPESTLQMEVVRNNIAKMIRSNSSSRISFTSYNRHAEINTYLDGLAAKYPNLVKVVTAGKTTEGRDLKYIKISSSNFNNASKPITLVDAGIHAREWIAPSVALYIIHKLVENNTETDLVKDMDWIIFPLLNPDGYEYSHTNTRLWRKTRSTKASTSCPGVDGNRNFDFKWMVSGSSSNPCSDTFAGPKPFSEPETQLFANVLLANKNRTKVYLAIHSYGSYVIYPYGYDSSLPENYKELDSVGLKVAAAIDAAAPSGSKKYKVGNSGSALYESSGASDDYAMGVGGVKLAYTLELPGGGSNGFDLPPTEINHVVKETWQGILVLARYAIDKAF